MSSDIDAMRAEVGTLYPGSRWKRRVAQMPDPQVMAIYFREKKKAEEAALAKKEQKNGRNPPV